MFNTEHPLAAGDPSTGVRPRIDFTHRRLTVHPGAAAGDLSPHHRARMPVDVDSELIVGGSRPLAQLAASIIENALGFRKLHPDRVGHPYK